ncbi:MAG: hypothetical protein WBD24_06210 [Candidatus Omnitrophota bacterium]
MKKIVATIAVFFFVMSAASAYAGSSQSTSTAKSESGWQKVYDGIANWSWSSGSTKSTTTKSGKESTKK